jgi:hypothetical protein
MKAAKFIICLTCIFGFFLFLADVGYAINDSEKAKIEYLISSISELKDAKFIRNGSEYDTAAASKHLRRKLKAAGNKISTAEEFIEYCATRSSISGEPYTIKLQSGVVQSGTYFREKLKSYTGMSDRQKSG